MSTLTNIPQHVFISYSRRNADEMKRIVLGLQQANIPVWTDERLKAGTPSWKNAIEHAIQNAFCVVVLMSPSAKTSEWIERELDYAYILHCPIYPILIVGTQRESVPFELIAMQYIDFRSEFDTALSQLVSLLHPYLATLAVVPQIPNFVPEQAEITFPEPINNKQQGVKLALQDSPFEEEKPLASRNIRKTLYWYFFAPRTFRLLIALNPDSAARFIHPNVTIMAYLWIIASTLIIRWFDPEVYKQAPNFLGFAIVGYSALVFASMVAPYKTIKGFIGYVSYTFLLSVLVAIVLGIGLLTLSSIISTMP